MEDNGWRGRTNREAELAPFKPQELIPTIGCARDRDRGTHLLDFTALSVNVQGLGGKHRYRSDQFLHKQYSVVFMQETKDKEGMINARDVLRLGSASDRHGGVAIWITTNTSGF